MATRILILGGGFAGVSAARSLVAQLRDEGRFRHPRPSQRSARPRQGADESVGNAPNPVLSGLAGQEEGDWLKTDTTLAVPGLRNVWAIGDCASVPHSRTGEPAPATAQHAVQQGPHLAANIMRAMAGQTLEPYHYHSKGMLVSLGTLRGAGSVLGLQVSGWPAWFLWRGYYLAQLPTFDRRFRVALDWLADLFLPRDIVQIDVRRSKTRPDPDGVVAETLELPVEGGR